MCTSRNKKKTAPNKHNQTCLDFFIRFFSGSGFFFIDTLASEHHGGPIKAPIGIIYYRDVRGVSGCGVILGDPDA